MLNRIGLLKTQKKFALVYSGPAYYYNLTQTISVNCFTIRASGSYLWFLIFDSLFHGCTNEFLCF